MNYTILIFILISPLVKGWGRSDKVLLKDVSVLTLKQGMLTSGRRSSPVPQLKCVGGTASGQFTPKVVQCYNRGSDGYDIQWECKSDMDNAYRFGNIQVSCEGYDYPDDPYILKGSCGLEYTIDLTQEGYERANQGGGGYYHGQGYNSHHGGQSYYSNYRKPSHYSSGDIIMIIIIGGLVYLIYRTCTRNRHHAGDDSPTPPSYSEATGYPSAPPPPPGFRPEYTPGSSFGPGMNTSPGYDSTGTTDGPGFWSGAATGGFLGYLFGSRNTYNTYDTYPRYHQHHHNRGWFSGWGGGSRGWGTTGYGTGGSSWFGNGSSHASSSHSSSSGRQSSGTRTASGFGGTTRR